MADRKVKDVSPHKTIRLAEPDQPVRRQAVQQTRAEPLKSALPESCNKKRPQSHKGDGTGRKFAGRYCAK